jgi:methyltransferase
LVAALPWLAAGLVALQRLAELRLARRNRARLLAQGGRELFGRHYPLIVLLHLAWLVSWPLEAFWRKGAGGAWWALWLGIFLLAQALRYWAIASLGHHWNTRIVVLPGVRIDPKGPFRWLAHPNYLAVALELASLPLVFGAWLSALGASLANALILSLVRIPAERRALAWAASQGDSLEPGGDCGKHILQR